MAQSEEDYSELQLQYYGHQSGTKTRTRPSVATSVVDSSPATTFPAASLCQDDEDTTAGDVTISDHSTITTSLCDGRYGKDRLDYYANSLPK